MNPEHFFTEGTKDKFLIQDPFGLREVIQPVVSISKTEDKITGLGTCFQISPWLWLTAHHVVRHSSSSEFPVDEVGAVGFSMGLVYGAVGFTTTDCFGEVRQIAAFKSEKADEIGNFLGPAPPEIWIDVASLRVNIDKLKKERLVSPLPIANDTPKIGDEILAIGYPILGSTFNSETSRMLFEERMYGAAGKVKALHPMGTSSSKPWPTFEIEGDWEAGMSGGPVINTDGQVVGIVSSSFAPSEEHPGVGFAVNLPLIPIKMIAPELDLKNPGFVFGYGVFKSETLTGFYPTEAIAKLAIGTSLELNTLHIALNPKTDDWIAV